MSRDPLEEQGGRNLFRYIDNDPIGSIDPFGLFGRGGMYNVTPHLRVFFKGHSAFTGSDIFDYNKEDDAWDSNPLSPWGMWRHFRDRSSINPDLSEAIHTCDRVATERLMHQLQDTYVHWDGGWRWWTMGHLRAWIGPDLDNDAWDRAESDTSPRVAIWKEHCCRAKAASDGWIHKDGSEGCCGPVTRRSE